MASSDDVKRLLRLSGALLKPPPRITPSQWADQQRIITIGPAPGPWQTSRTPYLREIMDRMDPRDPCDHVTLVMGSQLGKSEGMNNCVGYWSDVSPGPILIVQPTAPVAAKYSRMRIAPMIADSPRLRSIYAAAKSRSASNSAHEKSFAGGHLSIVGAGSPNDLSSTPFRFVCIDEEDRFGSSAGSDGDPMQLALVRTTAYRDTRKIWECSTPLDEGTSKISKSFAKTDKRRYFVPCAHCGHKQVLVWQRLRWLAGDGHDAAYHCEDCGCAWTDGDRLNALESGKWLPSMPAIRDGVPSFIQNPDIDPNAKRMHYGYHMSSLYSPWLSHAHMAANFLEVLGDPAKLKVWVNTFKAETWKPGRAGRPDVNLLLDRCEPVDFALQLAAGVACITAGVDVQGDRLEAEIVGWGAEFESWQIARASFYGDPSGPDLWRLLDELLWRTYSHPLTPKGLSLGAACVDTGGHHGTAVYRFCADKQQRRVWAIKGHSTAGKPPWPRTTTKSPGGRAPLYMLGVDGIKESVYARLRVPNPGPGYCHFPAMTDANPSGCDEAYFKQLTAERMTTVRNRKGHEVTAWTLRPGARNEALDLRVYATAAMHGLEADGFRIPIILDALRREGESLAKPPPPPASPAQSGRWIPDVGKGWL